MELNYFKDMLFDVINDSDKMKVSDIEADDRKNILMVTMLDGSTFAVKCRMADGENFHNKRVVDLAGARW